MRTIRAAVCRTFGAPLEIEVLDLAAPGPGAVEVEIEACAVCHSDITFMEGGWGGELPAVYG
ncbi:MAG: alcohol dehydrogenase catalytic domain-containing protein, partial [Pseudomonadota bacterium]